MSYDPFKELLYKPKHKCPHGNGDNCECKSPQYAGLFVWPLVTDDNKTVHIVSRMKQTHEGGMREFIDPLTGETVGSCGCNFAADNVVTLASFHFQAGNDEVISASGPEWNTWLQHIKRSAGQLKA